MSRPYLFLHDLFCVKCQKEPDAVAHYGIWGAKAHRKRIRAQVMCHGVEISLSITFDALVDIQSRGERMRLFDEEENNENSPLTIEALATKRIAP